LCSIQLISSARLRTLRFAIPGSLSTLGGTDNKNPSLFRKRLCISFTDYDIRKRLLWCPLLLGPLCLHQKHIHGTTRVNLLPRRRVTAKPKSCKVSRCMIHSVASTHRHRHVLCQLLSGKIPRRVSWEQPSLDCSLLQIVQAISPLSRQVNSLCKCWMPSSGRGEITPCRLGFQCTNLTSRFSDQNSLHTSLKFSIVPQKPITLNSLSIDFWLTINRAPPGSRLSSESSITQPKLGSPYSLKMVGDKAESRARYAISHSSLPIRSHLPSKQLPH
jgi:hypothetical protein